MVLGVYSLALRGACYLPLFEWAIVCSRHLLFLFSCQLRPTLCDPLDDSRPGSPVLHYLLEFA